MIEIPADIDAVRSADPALATRWRAALRTAVTDAYGSGLVIVGLNQDKAYVARRKESR